MNLTVAQIRLMYHLKHYHTSALRSLYAEGFQHRTVEALIKAELVAGQWDGTDKQVSLTRFGKDLLVGVERMKTQKPPKIGEDFDTYSLRMANSFKSRKS